MSRITVKKLRLARIASTARANGHDDQYERAANMLAECEACGEGEELTEQTLPTYLSLLGMEVASFAWPAVVVEHAAENYDPGLARRQLESARTQAANQTRARIRASRRALASGDLRAAVEHYRVAQSRWASFIAQSSRIGIDARQATQPWYERWSDAVTHATTPAPGEDHIYPAWLPWAAVLGIGWYLGR
jgi:hypothetical protein